MPAIPAAALLCGLVFLFKPAQLYEANAPFFYFGFAQISLVLVCAFLASFAALAWLASRGAPRWQRGAAALLGGVALAAWINASFVPSPGGPLDGRHLLLPFDDQRVGLNLLMCAGVAAAGCALAWRFPALARRFFAALFVVLAAQTIWIAASDEHPWRGPSAGARLVELSSEKNVIVVLLDAFQSDFFAEMLQREPALATRFDGFTYFGNAVSPAPTTYLALPAIHSGIAYREGEGLRGTYRDSVVEGSFMAQLARNGYDAMLVNPLLNYCPQGVLCDHEGVLAYGRAKTLAESAAFLFDLALFRIVPDAVKPSVYAAGSWMLTRALAEQRAVTSNRVLELMAGSLRVATKRPAARFVHLFGSHAPAQLDAECRPVTDLPWVRRSAIAQDRCAIEKLGAVLDTLRALGVYDRTAIVVLADHGSGLPRDGEAWVWGAFASPLLLVKPFEARGALAPSARVVGLTDVAASICAWTGDCRMESGSDLARDSGEPPRYPFFVYHWRHEYWVAESVPIEERYEVRGPPGERASWARVSR